MKRFITILFLALFFITADVFGDGIARITARPSHIDLTSENAQSAVLVSLNGYSSDQVRYRLFNGINQYYCWDPLTGTYISSSNFIEGPLALGQPSLTTEFWIVFRRGSNTSALASYIDRVQPFTDNNNTAILPSAAEITSPFILTGTLAGSSSFPLSEKYVILGFSGGTLVCATSSDLSTGVFYLTCPSGTIIDKVEVRTLINTTIRSVTVFYTGSGDMGIINLSSSTDVTAPVFVYFPTIDEILETSVRLQIMMDEPGKVFYMVVPDGATAPTVDQIVAGVNYGSVTPAAAGSFDAVFDGYWYDYIYGLKENTTYDIYIVAQDDEEFPNRQTTATLVEFQTLYTPDIICYSDFSSSLDPFTQVSLAGAQVWNQYVYTNAFGYTSTWASMYGYSGGTRYLNADWLISPAINLDHYENKMFSFMTAKNGTGPALKVMISSNFSGDYSAAGIAAATWTDITSNFRFSTANFNGVGSDKFGLEAYSGDIHIAFVYESTTSAAAQWMVTFFEVVGDLILSSDATLSDLKVNGATLTGFNTSTYMYNMVLAEGTSTVPDVSYTLNDASASAIVTNATDLAGDAAARTTTVEVTAANGTTKQTYSIQFNPVIAVADLATLRAVTINAYDRVYKVTGQVVITGLNPTAGNSKYMQDASAGIYIYDSGSIITTSHNIGDGITGLTGTLYNYNDMLEFIPYSDPGVNSTGNVVTSQTITISEFKTNFESYEAELIRITGLDLVIADGSATFGTSSDNYAVTAGTDATVIRTAFPGTDIGNKLIPYMADVTGIAIWHMGEAMIAPRSYSDFVIYSSDASLNDLKVNNNTVAGFATGTYAYNVSLPAGTTIIPTVSATSAEINASVTVVQATSLTGDAAARTATVEVVSHDKSATKQYTVVFTVLTGIDINTAPDLKIYPVPALTEITIEDAGDVSHIEVFDVTGKKRISENYSGMNIIRINVSQLVNGFYFIRFTTPKGTVMKRFVKE